jgi:phosphate transport system protein
LAKRQPVARDLRFVMTTLKVVTDLERIGDLSCHVAQLVLDGLPAREQDVVGDITAAGQTVIGMLRDAVDALMNGDAERAAEVIRTDEQVDADCAGIARNIAERIVRSPLDVDALMRLIALTRSVERAGDHGTNVAEMVVFLAKGHHIRHLRRINQGGTPQVSRAQRP